MDPKLMMPMMSVPPNNMMNSFGLLQQRPNGPDQGQMNSMLQSIQAASIMNQYQGGGQYNPQLQSQQPLPFQQVNQMSNPQNMNQNNIAMMLNQLNANPALLETLRKGAPH
jgi:hypothetical protein